MITWCRLLIAVVCLACVGCASRTSTTTEVSSVPLIAESGAPASVVPVHPIPKPIPSASYPSSVNSAKSPQKVSQTQHATTPQPQAVGQRSFTQGKHPASAPVGQTQHRSSSKLVTAERAAYDQALSAYRNKQPQKSMALFEAFAQKYPASRLLPNALYWKGECLYVQGKYADAIFIFKNVTERFPKHHKGSDALLKTGMAYDRLGDKDNASLHYRVLFEDYPTSEAVQHAKVLGLHP